MPSFRSLMTSRRHAGRLALPEARLPAPRRMASEPSSQMMMRAKFERLAELEHWIQTLAVEFLLPPSLVQRIDLCLTELVTNVIGYGYPDGANGTISIRFWRQPEQIVIRIDDDGVPFDPTGYVLPALPGTLAEASSGGRGIRLVRHFADALQHLRVASGNQLTLSFRCPAQQARLQ
jgi:anti-sigma regulatory factor (Ser/Thr protein kinase)